MKKFKVSLILLTSGKPMTVEVQAINAILACDIAQSLNPGTLASGANLVS